MGYAQGELYKDKLQTLVQVLWAYLESEVEEVMTFVPKWLAELIADLGLDAALDFTELFSRSYTSPHFYNEMRGLADASGADFQSKEMKN